MANIILRLSAGTTGTSTSSGADNSLGGNMGTDDAAKITTANTSLNNLFDNISKLENSDGVTDYRCIFIHNDTAIGGDVFADGAIYLQGDPKANISIGLDVVGKNQPAWVIADENEAPTSVTFSAPTELSPLALLTTVDEGEYVPVWIKRTAQNVAGSGTVTDVISLVVRGIE